MIAVTQMLFMQMFYLGIGLAILWCLINICASAVSLAWSWVTDGDHDHVGSPITAAIAKALGWKSEFQCYKTKTRGYVDEGVLIIWPAGVLLVTPLALLCIQAVWELVAFAIVMFLLMHLARFVLRLNKALKKHMEDKNAH